MLNNLRSAEARYEHDVANLKSYIIELKSRLSSYIPVKNDQTDLALADYINSSCVTNAADNNRQKLQIMFMRESAGVYEFGTRRIMLKTSLGNNECDGESNGKLLVKVGAANWVSIDEFLERSMQEEIAKLEARREPLKQISMK